VKKLLGLVVLATLALSVTATASPAQTTAQANIVQTAQSSGQFTTLVKLLARAGLAGALEKPGPFTVFAPTDAAFAKVPKKTLGALLQNKAELRAVLLYHVVSGRDTAADVVKLTSAKTLNGQRVRIRVSSSHVFVSGAEVTKPDVMASNGVIHVIDRVLIPPTP
jgi:uncharacterized surface protein with fasciclin (FAS1) repeats